MYQFVMQLAEYNSVSIDDHQAATLKPYLTAVRHTLTGAMCLEDFSSQVVERHNKPEVEVRSVSLMTHYMHNGHCLNGLKLLKLLTVNSGPVLCYYDFLI